ncbi:N-acetyltransferase family protein [Rubrivirga sp.]|uniref:GNAT family N-acetyltransferase n=1 Tax=Rubrivirga sp. TaxID=1885344 RepID=UPI003C73D3DD
MNISRATIADLEAAAPLFDRYRQYYRQPSDLEGARRFLRDRFEADESVLFLATVRGLEAAVGFTQLYPFFSSVGMQRVWVLNDLFVGEEARRRGVGRALMEAAHDFARGDGGLRVELATEKTNVTAQALYDDMGYVLEDDVFRYSLALKG